MLKNRLKSLPLIWKRAVAWMDAHRMVLSICTGLLMAAVLALYNVSAGPLHNLNDIGGWKNRAMLILCVAGVHGALTILCAILSKTSFVRTVLRQGILTAGLDILLLAMNQKGYVFVQQMLPVIRAMDVRGLVAGAESGMSAPMLLLVYGLTRSAIYSLYMLKTLAIACLLVLALLAMRVADRAGLGIRAEVLLTLCVILPQGFLHTACSALLEIVAVTLLAVALTLLAERKNSLACGLCWGAASALCGVGWYMMPVMVWAVLNRRMKKKDVLGGALLAVLLCMPAVGSGMHITQALGSLFTANFASPMYANGAPHLYHLIPRATMTEIPQYASMLRHMPALDEVTHDQVFYTQEHFNIVMRGVILMGLAMYMGLCALVGTQMRHKSNLQRLMVGMLGTLMICPHVSGAVWLMLDVLCLYALVAEPKLRLPACMVLFATMTSASYPMTEVVMLPMVVAFVLCLVAWCLLTEIIPMGEIRKE